MCLGYDTKASDGETPVLKLWGMWSTPLLPLTSGSLWSEVVIPVRVPSMGQMEISNHFLYLQSFKCVQTND